MKLVLGLYNLLVRVFQVISGVGLLLAIGVAGFLMYLCMVAYCTWQVITTGKLWND